MRYFMFNKPRGCITAVVDARHKTVIDYFPKEEAEGLFPVGRLDKDTEGFLILTDDGNFCNRVNLPTSVIPKTYRFYSKGILDPERLETLETGVSIAAIKDRLTAPAEVKILGVCTFRDAVDYMAPEFRAKIMNTRMGERPLTHGEITITEGKKHQVKKMIAAVGGYVVYLERVAIGDLHIDENLARGEYREITEAELDLITKDR